MEQTSQQQMNGLQDSPQSEFWNLYFDLCTLIFELWSLIFELCSLLFVDLAEDPSSASHQRQMSRRLSEIFDRLKFNEGMEKILQTATAS